MPQLSQLALKYGYDVNYLGLLARQGKLEARKWKGRWHATPAAMTRYQEEAQIAVLSNLWYTCSRE
jgi:hypothetical protein